MAVPLQGLTPGSHPRVLPKGLTPGSHPSVPSQSPTLGSHHRVSTQGPTTGSWVLGPDPGCRSYFSGMPIIKTVLSEAVTWRCSVSNKFKKNYVIFTGKRLCRSLFFNKLNRVYVSSCFYKLFIQKQPFPSNF